VLPQWKPIEFFNPAPTSAELHQWVLQAEAQEAQMQYEAPQPLTDALHRQIGGAHYKGLKIQPMEYSIANGLNACEHTAIKYITRKKGDKAKRLEDLDKAIHSIELLKQFIEDGTLVD
jgi:hypothetical protein